MKIGTTTDYMARAYGDEDALKKIAKIGYDCVDFGMFKYPTKGELFQASDSDFERYFSALKVVANENSIYIGQVHSPMPSYSTNEEENEFIFGIQVKAIKAAAYIGSDYIVIHPAIPQQYKYDFYRAETKVINMDFYSRLLPYLKKYNVKLAIENMFNWDETKNCICPTVCSTAEEMLDYIDTLNDEHFVACLDIGHANLTGDTPENMIRILGKKLEILHIHDNNGYADQHIAPYMGNINWANVCNSLKEVDYKGTFSFEADSFHALFGPKLAFDSATMLYKIGKNLVEEFNL